MVHRSEAAVLGSFALVCVFVLSLPLVTTRIYASDEVEYFAWLRSWAFDRDVDFENEYRHFYDSGQVQTASFHETFLERENEAGRRLNFAPIGTAILWAPFYGAGHLAALATGAPADGFSAPYVAAVAYGSAIYGFLAVRALARRSRGGSSGRGLRGEPRDLDRHAAAVLHVRRAAVRRTRARRSRWRCSSGRGCASASAGRCAASSRSALTGALMAMVREQDVFFLAGPGDRFRALGGRRRARGVARSGRCSTRMRVAAIGAAAFVLVAYSPQLVGLPGAQRSPGPDDAT